MLAMVTACCAFALGACSRNPTLTARATAGRFFRSLNAHVNRHARVTIEKIDALGQTLATAQVARTGFYAGTRAIPRS